MRILFDQGTPAPLRSFLPGHEIETAYERDWQILTNGELLYAAENNRFDMLVTTDQNLRYQQNLAGRQIIIIVLLTTSWPRLKRNVELIVQAIESSSTGGYYEVGIP